MFEDVVEVAADVLLSGITPEDAPKRYRKGCWALTFIILALVVIAGIVIVLDPSLIA
jgi:hypothetical protein